MLIPDEYRYIADYLLERLIGMGVIKTSQKNSTLLNFASQALLEGCANYQLELVPKTKAE